MSEKQPTTSLSYEQACEAHFAQPGNRETPKKELSEDFDGLWHLANDNGPLAAVTSDGEVIPVGDFFAAYERLSKQGKCDRPGEMEYGRVLAEWIEDRPDDLEKFIVQRSNVGPIETTDDQLILSILCTLEERGRISVEELAADMDSTAKALQVPLARLADDEKVSVTETDVVLKMSGKDRKDFERLDRKFEKGQRESIAALREIRERKLFREQFHSFTAYVAARGKTVPWATQQINWLRRIELLEQNGKDSYRSLLTVDDVQVLGPLEDEPEAFVRAVVEGVEEAESQGMKQKKPFLKEAVGRQQRYFERLKNLAVSDLTYDESMALDQLGDAERAGGNLVEQARSQAAKSGEAISDCLIVACDRERAIPSELHLLSAFRADDLKVLVAQLEDRLKAWDEEDTLQEEEEEILKKQLSSVQRKLGRLPEADEADDEGEEPEVSESDRKSEDDVLDDRNEDHVEGSTAQPQYEVVFTGDFSSLVKKEFGMSHTKHMAPSELAGVLTFLGDVIKDGTCLSVTSSVTVDLVSHKLSSRDR